MRAGTLRHKVAIEQRSVTTDTYGGEVVTWLPFTTAWADIQPLSGREMIAAQAVQSEITSKVIMRYIPGVLPSMRVVFEGRYYDIQSVIDWGMRHQELNLMCSEGLSQG